MRTHDNGSHTSSVAQRASRVLLSALLALSVCPLAVRAEEDVTDPEVIEAEETVLVEGESEAEGVDEEVVNDEETVSDEQVSDEQVPEVTEAEEQAVEEEPAVAAAEATEEPAEKPEEPVELGATSVEIVAASSNNLSDATIEPIADQAYTGKEVRPELTVTLNGILLFEDVEGFDGDYTVEYTSNTKAGTATVIITGVNAYEGTNSATFTIEPHSIAKAGVSGLTAQTYTGSALKPKPTVKTTLNGATKTLTAGTDYTVAYKNNTNAGTATVTIKGKGNFTGTITKTFAIKAASLAKAKVTASSQTYSGKKLTPAPTVKLGTKTLKKGTDYTVTYSANLNAGTATITIKGKGNYTGTAKGTFTIKRVSLSKATIGSIATQTWDGSAKTPNPTVKYGSLTLVKDRDYTLSYKNNVQPNAKATVTITGKGNYTGTRTTTFTIGAKSGEWRKSNGLWWWRWADGSYAKSEFLTIKNVTYYFDSEGWMETGWAKLGGHWYYFDPSSGAMKTGWLNLNGTWYWLDNEGQMVTGWKKISDKWYWFNASGEMGTGLKKIGGKVYYFGANGAMVTGWTQIDKYWYHFDENGVASSGWYKVGNKWYYGSENGRMATGWKTLNNVRYYLDPSSGAMATGWTKISDRWYWFDEESGAMATSRWIESLYYVGVNGYMYTDRYTPDGYYVGKDGKWDGKDPVKVQSSN